MENIRSLDLDELTTKILELKESKFRAQQIYQWLWKYRVSSFEEMSNLSTSLREKLSVSFFIDTISIDQKQISKDGTIKVGFNTSDGNAIEGVIIPTQDRYTACISSQIGCSLACTFCATGLLDRKRNLHAYEIYDQVFLLNQLSLAQNDQPLTNIVYMGMGEPLLNYHEVVKSLKLLHDNKYGMGIGMKRMTVSTSGVSRNIIKLADEGIKPVLALSLHAPNNTIRDSIMDINRSNPLEKVLDALKYYHDKTGNRISYEYVLLNGVNDSEANAEELVKLCQDFPVFVNLIEYNLVEEIPFVKTKKENREKFLQVLNNHKVPCAVRISRGKDIDAACGQLANKIKKSA